MPDSETLTIAPAVTAAGIETVRGLFTEYWLAFGFSPCFQGFSAELAGLPGKYAPPRGRLAIAWIGGQPAGCVALRPIDDLRCEGKRLFVPERFRSRGVGRALLDWLIAEARSAGYTELLADTLPVMERALAMYQRLGFEPTAPYLDSPTPGAIPIRLVLG